MYISVYLYLYLPTYPPIYLSTYLFLRHSTPVHSSFRNKNVINPGPFLSHDSGQNISIPISISKSKIGQPVASVTVWRDVTKLILRLHLEVPSASYVLEMTVSGSNNNRDVKVYIPVYTVSYTRRRTPTSIFTPGSKTWICATSGYLAMFLF